MDRLKELAPEIRKLVKRKPATKEEVAKYTILGASAVAAVAALVILVLTAMGNMPWPSFYYTDWFLVALILSAGPWGFMRARETKRVEEVDEKFPDFLRDLAESARAGMTLPRAMVAAAEGSYGALTPDIKRMAAQVEWGIDFTEVLDRYAKQGKSPLIKRIVSLIIEARRSGGNVVDVLTAASEDAREIKQIVDGRNQQMASYSMVIYITFFVFVTVVIILQAQFIPAFADAVEAAGGATQVGGLKFEPFDPNDFNTLFFHAALIQAIGGGFVGGVLSRGTPIAGLKSIVIMVIIAWASFRLVV